MDLLPSFTFVLCGSAIVLSSVFLNDDARVATPQELASASACAKETLLDKTKSGVNQPPLTVADVAHAESGCRNEDATKIQRDALLRP